MISYRQCASRFLMIKPDNFFFNIETAKSNAFQFRSGFSKSEIKNKVQVEFKNAVEVLKKECVEIDLIDPILMNDLPDQVYPNNWFQVTHDGKLVLFPMQSTKRRKERQLYIIDYIKSRYLINEVVDLSNYEKNYLFLEGTGSVVLDHVSKIAYAASSPRTSEKMFRDYCEIIGYKGVFFNAIDVNGVPVYHTNVLMSIGPGFSVICLELISKPEREIVIESLSSSELEIIEIDQIQMGCFCGNILTVLVNKEEYLVLMSERAEKAFNKHQLDAISNYAKKISVPINVIENIGGGGVRCMMAEIFSPLL